MVGDARTRGGLTQVLAIAGQALPPSVMLAYGYLAANAGQTSADIGPAFKKTVINLGVVWGLFSVMVIVAGTTALHDVYTGEGPEYLGVSHYSQIESIPVAGQVLGPAFPGRPGFSRATVLFARPHRGGVHDAHLGVAHDDLLLPGHGAPELAIHARQHALQGRVCLWIVIPSLLAPFWKLPALLKAILAMVGNLVLAPVAVAGDSVLRDASGDGRDFAPARPGSVFWW